MVVSTTDDVVVSVTEVVVPDELDEQADTAAATTESTTSIRLDRTTPPVSQYQVLSTEYRPRQGLGLELAMGLEPMT